MASWRPWCAGASRGGRSHAGGRPAGRRGRGRCRGRRLRLGPDRRRAGRRRFLERRRVDSVGRHGAGRRFSRVWVLMVAEVWRHFPAAEPWLIPLRQWCRRRRAASLEPNRRISSGRLPRRDHQVGGGRS